MERNLLTTKKRRKNKPKRKAEKSETVRINFDFPKKEYPYLKMLCAKRGVSLKKFATDLIAKAIEDFEDVEFTKVASNRQNKEEEFVSFEKMMELQKKQH